MRNSQNLRDLDDLCKTLQLNLLERGEGSPVRTMKVDHSQGKYLSFNQSNEFKGNLTTWEVLARHQEAIDVNLRSLSSKKDEDDVEKEADPTFAGRVAAFDMSVKTIGAQNMLSGELNENMQILREEAARSSTDQSVTEAQQTYNPFTSNQTVPEEDSRLEEDSPDLKGHKYRRDKNENEMDESFERDRFE